MSTDIYHQEIMRWAKMDAGPEGLENPDCQVTLDNPLCGDRVHLELCVNDGRISAETHHVKGCLLCRASANIIGQSAVGLGTAEVDQIDAGLRAILTTGKTASWPIPGWEALDAFKPVASHTSRHECVLLPFQALATGLRQYR